MNLDKIIHSVHILVHITTKARKGKRVGAEDATEKGIARFEWSDGGGRGLIGGRRYTGEERRAK